MLFVCLGICLEIFPEIYHVGQNIKKVMVSWNLCHAHLLEVGMTKILGDHETLSTICHVGFHVDYSSIKYALGL